jgi:hypothetical protein
MADKPPEHQNFAANIRVARQDGPDGTSYYEADIRITDHATGQEYVFDLENAMTSVDRTRVTIPIAPKDDQETSPTRRPPE